MAKRSKIDKIKVKITKSGKVRIKTGFGNWTCRIDEIRSLTKAIRKALVEWKQPPDSIIADDLIDFVIDRYRSILEAYRLEPLPEIPKRG